MSRIPVITNYGQLISILQAWQRGMKPVVKRISEPEIPFNFQATSVQGGNRLTWAAVVGADGYIIEWNLTGDFETGFTAINIKDSQATDYTDIVPTASGAAPAKRYYRMYATAGTVLSPQSVKGNYTAVISATAIAPNDTVTASSTALDNSTSDQDQVWYRGRYGDAPF